MAQVWTRLGVYILTGLNLIFLEGCIFNYDNKQYSNEYRVRIINNSPDSLLISWYDSGRVYNPIELDENVLYSSEEKSFGQLGFDGNRNPTKVLFDSFWENQNFWIYSYSDELISKSDSQRFFIPVSSELLKKWDGPAAEMGDSVHHFFNYSSWEVIPYPEDSVVDGIIVFTITEDDLQ